MTAAEKRGFLPLCPDFVVELRSTTDRLSDLQIKMQEYMENGALLGWLIDPETRAVHIYRPDAAPFHQTELTELSAEPELPGFTLDLETIWDPGF